ncbi:MAG: MFS transporter [Bryobacteraceae bacterium]|nr:MFS transporter [Bryobacteraceae bacterium]
MNSRKWWICGLLLCASTINYMDRVTLASVARRVIEEFSLSKQQYGMIEQYFGYAFAVGSVVFGILVDRVSARWLYPAVLLLWSAAGMMTGLAGLAGFGSAFGTLLFCRTLLGLFESGHWPCALQTTQILLEPKDRALGNGVLQSGVSIGAIVTPVIVGAMLTSAPGSWRLPFLIIGGIGLLWVVAWIYSTREVQWDARPKAVREPFWPAVAELVSDRRFWILAFAVSAINVPWGIFRVWLPLVFQDPHGLGFTEAETLGRVLPGYYIMTDVGCLAAGWATVWMHGRGTSVLNSRRVVFTVCAGLTMLAMLVPGLSRGDLAIPGVPARVAATLVMMLVAAGSLGVYPCYYAFVQELSRARLGLVSGMLGFLAWVSGSSLQRPLGAYVDQTGSYDIAFLIGAWPSIFAAALLWFAWGGEKEA